MFFWPGNKEELFYFIKKKRTVARFLRVLLAFRLRGMHSLFLVPATTLSFFFYTLNPITPFGRLFLLNQLRLEAYRPSCIYHGSTSLGVHPLGNFVSFRPASLFLSSPSQ